MNLQRLWSLGGGLVEVLSCQMTRVVRGPVTFLLLRKIGKICCQGRFRCLEPEYCHGAGGERGLAQCFAGFVAWTLLDSESFRVAIAIRVGTDVCIPNSCLGWRMNSRGLHGLFCKLVPLSKAFGSE